MSSVLSLSPAEPSTGVPLADPLERRLPGLALLLRRLWWAVLGATVGLALGVGLGLAREQMYESTTYVTVTSATGADAGSIARAAQALARIATAPEVISPALQQAGLTEAAQRPRMFITVQAAPDAPLISVTGIATDARDAQAIATTVADTLAGVQNLGQYRAFSVADAPVPGSPSTPGWLLSMGGAALGLGIAVVLAATIPPRRRNRSGGPDRRSQPPAAVR
jgi:capsular polysaccharide biosynthesis protein